MVYGLILSNDGQIFYEDIPCNVVTIIRFDCCNKINKILKFKKGVGIAIKSKETSSKLAI